MLDRIWAVGRVVLEEYFVVDIVLMWLIGGVLMYLKDRRDHGEF